MPLIHDTWAGSLTPHGLELYYGAAWHDITADLGDDGVSIRRGRSAEAGRIEPGEMNLTLDNTGGKYSPRNPSSSLYGLIGRNTPIRYWVKGGTQRLVVPATASTLTAPDDAGLSVTSGDLDFRIDMRMRNWHSQVDLISKYVSTGNQRSYELILYPDGILAIFWSHDGTTTVGQLFSAEATAPIPHETGRLSIRATLDADNGSGVREYKFYYSETPGLSGPWTQIGDTVPGGATTTIYDSTAPVTIGDTAGQARLDADIYAVELRSVIGGTVVFSLDFEAATIGAGTIVSGGRTWTLNGDAAITDKHYRFTGEVAAWPQQWSEKGTPYTPIQCAGVTRRLGQGAAVLKSAYYRGVTSATAPIQSITAYWPMEDGKDATSFAPGYGSRPARITGAPRLADSSPFAASEALPTLQTGAVINGNVPAYTATGEVQAYLLVSIPEAGLAAAHELLAFVTTGTAYRWSLQVETSGSLTLRGYDTSNTLAFTMGPTAFGVNGRAFRLGIHLANNGSNVDVTVSTLEPADSTGEFASQTWSSVQIGRADAWAVGGTGGCPDVVVGHLTFQDEVGSIFEFSDLLAAYRGELAWPRIDRLSGEEGIVVDVVGDSSDWNGFTANHDATEPLGFQTRDELLELLFDAAATDGGLLYEPRGSSDLAYRTRLSMGAQLPALTVDYLDNMPMEPTEDDQQTVNRATVTRAGGGAYAYEETAGALGSATVGTYDASATLSLEDDTDAADQASWRVHAGTIDEARWPTIGIDLAHPSIKADLDLVRDVLDVDLGDRVVVNDLPSWLPPFSVDQIVQGYTELVTPSRYKLTLNCTPAAVHQVAIYDYEQSRYSGEGTELAEVLDTTETGVDITCPAALRWGHSDGDYLIVIGGEVMQVTAVSGTGTAQTLTVVRSINGVVKTHAISDAVDLYTPSYYSL